MVHNQPPPSDPRFSLVLIEKKQDFHQDDSAMWPPDAKGVQSKQPLIANPTQCLLLIEADVSATVRDVR
jgi:hypothetical protein